MMVDLPPYITLRTTNTRHRVARSNGVMVKTLCGIERLATQWTSDPAANYCLTCGTTPERAHTDGQAT